MIWVITAAVVWSAVSFPLGLLIGKSIKAADKHQLRVVNVDPIMITGPMDLVRRIRFEDQDKL